MAMEWKGRRLVTIGDLMTHGIDACATREEAREFMRLYRAETPHAGQNIGYLAGYYSHEAMARIHDWFECAHPIFGTHAPTPQEAFRAGLQLAGAAPSPARDSDADLEQGKGT